MTLSTDRYQILLYNICLSKSVGIPTIVLDIIVFIILHICLMSVFIYLINRDNNIVSYCVLGG